MDKGAFTAAADGTFAVDFGKPRMLIEPHFAP
jgi:hypothetical protein